MQPQQVCCRCSAAYAADPLQERFGGVCPRCLATFAFDGPAEAGAGESSWPALPGIELLEVLGRGGMGVVYRAYQPELDREVAVKLMRDDRVGTADFDERFRREARAQASLDHPGIARVLEFGVTGDGAYLVMELVDGPSLRELLRGGPLPAALALDLATQLAAVLEFAHGQDIVHRDLKPENLLLAPDNRLRVVDFGLARQLGDTAWTRLTAPGGRVGTPMYMAPEQLAGDAADERADIYALGVVLYEMLTGELPMGRYTDPSESSDVGPQVDAVVSQALERTPDDRQQSAAELRRQLDAAPDPVERLQTLPAAPLSRGGLVGILGLVGLLIATIFYDLWLIFSLRGEVPRLIEIGAGLPVPTVWMINIADLFASFWFILGPMAVVGVAVVIGLALSGQRLLPTLVAGVMLLVAATVAVIGTASNTVVNDLFHLVGPPASLAASAIPADPRQPDHTDDWHWTQTEPQIHKHWLVLTVTPTATVDEINTHIDRWRLTILGGDPSTGQLTVSVEDERMRDEAAAALRASPAVRSVSEWPRLPQEQR